MCSTTGMRDARPRGLDLSLAAVYDSAEEEGFSGVVNKEKNKGKDKTTTEDNE